MHVAARSATVDDVGTLERLYAGLRDEMTELHGMWPMADGLEEPIDESFRRFLEAEDVILLIGTIDEYPFGFLMARVETMLPQAGDESIGVIRLIYVDHEAREVAVGEAMRDEVLARLRDRGISKFDAHVLPGHRLAKNFFESGGFSARSIVMHHDDDRG